MNSMWYTYQIKLIGSCAVENEFVIPQYLVQDSEAIL
jgi:hypothetical protein